MLWFLRKALRILAGVLWVYLLGLPLVATALQASEDSHGYGALFSEEILTVNRERDGILPGTLRSAVVQANSIRAQNSFALVRIVFDPAVERVRITKGPLPEIDGSLTTIDCSRFQSRIVLEYVKPEDNAGEDPGEEASVFTLSSNGNVIRNCHITGAVGPGILVRGNRNVIEQNTIGFHAEVAEAAVPPSALLNDPQTNGRSGITLGKGSNENLIQHNNIIGNTYHGVYLEDGVGTGNKILYNFFAKNSGLPIKEQPGNQSALTPTIKKITQQGDTFYIEGSSSPGAHVQIYLVGEKRDQIEMLVAEGQDHPKNNSAVFSLATKSKGFVLGHTQVVALAHGENLNTSEFSDPIIVGIPEHDISVEPAPENPEAAPDTAGAEEKTEGETETTTEAPAQAPTPESNMPSTPQGTKTGKNLGGEPDTVINLHGQGDGGSSPDSGVEKQNSITGMGN
jgi:hypothetical protein